MLRLKMAVDLGTACSMLATSRDVSFVQMPSCVLIDSETNEILEFGSLAKAQVGRCSEKREVRFPIQRGVVCDFDLTERMLEILISHKQSSVFGYAKEIYVCAPWCSTAAELKAYEAFLKDQDKKIVIVREPYAAAIGLGWRPETQEAITVVDLGGGSVEISSLQNEFIFSVHSLKQAGQYCDLLIQQYFRKNHGLEVGPLQAEFVKINCVNLMDPSTRQSYPLAGFDRTTKKPKKINFYDGELNRALQPFLDSVLNLIANHRATLSESQRAQLEKEGLWLTGGTSLLSGLDFWLQEKLGFRVFRANDPQQSVIMGMRHIMRKPRAFRPILEISRKVCPS